MIHDDGGRKYGGMQQSQVLAGRRTAKMESDINRKRQRDTSVRKKPFKVLLHSGPGRLAEGKAVKKSTDLAIKGQYRRTGVWPKGTVEIEG